MKRRLIINIDDECILTDAQVLEMVSYVVSKGRISETASRKHYCHIVKWTESKTCVYAVKRTESTDTFYIRCA